VGVFGGKKTGLNGQDPGRGEEEKWSPFQVVTPISEKIPGEVSRGEKTAEVEEDTRLAPTPVRRETSEGPSVKTPHKERGAKNERTDINHSLHICS